MPRQSDITKAKKWMRLRNDNADTLVALIESLLESAVEQLTVIAYKYNCKPEDFHFAQDKKLREEVADVMSALETDVMDLTQAYSLKEPNADKRHDLLLAWLLALKSKNTENLQQTLHLRLQQFLFDTEASLAAMLIAGHNLTVARTSTTESAIMPTTAYSHVSSDSKDSFLTITGMIKAITTAAEAITNCFIPSSGSSLEIMTKPIASSMSISFTKSMEALP